MTRIVWLDERGAISAEDSATGPDALRYVQSAKLAQAFGERRAFRIEEADGGVTYVVRP